MNEKDDNYYSSIFNVDLNKVKAMIYFKAKDKRGYTTKFPSSILGDYFTCRKSDGKVEIIRFK